LGSTDITGSTRAQFTVRTTQATTGYEGRLEPTTAGSVNISARYPAPGLYPMRPPPGSRPRQVLISDEVSALIRAGEQEHSNDFHLAHQAVYGVVARVINELAAGPAKTAATGREVRELWLAALYDAFPPLLQARVDEFSPNRPWNELLARLNGLSNERDASHWHDMGSGFATMEDRTAHSIPDDQDLVRILPGGQIGQHGSQERIDAAAPGLTGPSPAAP
jgi:hypothetical protein